VTQTRGDNCLDRQKMRQVIWSNYCAFCVWNNQMHSLCT